MHKMKRWMPNDAYCKWPQYYLESVHPLGQQQGGKTPSRRYETVKDVIPYFGQQEMSIILRRWFSVDEQRKEDAQAADEVGKNQPTLLSVALII